MLYLTMNRLGQSGKTTTARYVLTPRIPGAMMLSAESTTADGKEDLNIRALGDKKGTQTLAAALAGIGAGNASHVLDVGSADTDSALPVILDHASRYPVHVIIPVRAAAKAASAALALVGNFEGRPGVLITLVANHIEEASAPSRNAGFVELGKAAAEHGAVLLGVGLVENEWLSGIGGIRSAEDLKKAATMDTEDLDRQCAAALKKLDMGALTRLGGERAKIEAAKRALENTQAVFDAIMARQECGSNG